ncbi:MAG: hypothetical protein HFE34_06115 [Clostridia bacterium]|nr:hypothetical protein [Clostridia bacterium]
MSVKILKCVNCGAKLERDKNNNWHCRNCGSIYLEKEDNIYIINNNNITKVYYGAAGKSEENKDKIAIYKARLYDELFDGSVAEARDYCVRLLNREPENNSITFVKKYIEKNLKQQNGRYSKISLYKALSILDEDLANSNIKFDKEFYEYLNRYLQKYLAEDKYYNHYEITNLYELCLSIEGMQNNISNAELRNTFAALNYLIKYKYDQDKIAEQNKRDDIDKMEKEWQKERTKKKTIIIVASCLVVFFIALSVIVGVVRKNQRVTVTYYASEGGYIARYNDNIKYTEWYMCTVQKNDDCDVMVALPMAGYEFAYWSDGVTTDIRQDKNVTSSFEVTAYFRLIE